MTLLFDIAAIVAFAATVLAVTRDSAVHALLYVVVSLLAVAFIFFLLGAPFVAALEAIVYAGAIMVLFLFVAMVLGMGRDAAVRERALYSPHAWIGPVVLSLVLLVAIGAAVARGEPRASALGGGVAKDLAFALFGPYLIATELASLLLLSGLVGAVHLGRGLEARAPSAEPLPPIPGVAGAGAEPWK